MTIKTTSHQRQQMFKAHLRGQSYREIAEAYGLSKYTVRYWCRRQRDGGSVRTQWYQSKRGVLSQYDPIVRYVVLRLRLEHARWGPRSILAHLRKRSSLEGKRLPSEASIGCF